jgi:AcrR family transcriptional regulator
VSPNRARLDAELTPRGERTRGALVAAARTIFERDGFLAARITDIAEEARVAHGTFYTYFEDKESIFGAVVESLQGDFLETDRPPPGIEETPFEQILRANRRYYDMYVKRAKLMGLVEQVATFNDEFRVLRRDVRHQIIERAERGIRRWQDQGLADPTIDAHYAANALGSMVDRSVYIWLVLEEPHDPELAIETLTRLWAKAIGLATPSADVPRRPPRRGRATPVRARRSTRD